MRGGLQVGDRVKLILDKERSPDNKWHGRTGEIVNITFDDLGSVTGNPEDNAMYRVELDNGEVPPVHFRHHDVVRLDEYQQKMEATHREE